MSSITVAAKIKFRTDFSQKGIEVFCKLGLRFPENLSRKKHSKRILKTENRFYRRLNMKVPFA